MYKFGGKYVWILRTAGLQVISQLRFPLSLSVLAAAAAACPVTKVTVVGSAAQARERGRGGSHRQLGELAIVTADPSPASPGSGVPGPGQAAWCGGPVTVTHFRVRADRARALSESVRPFRVTFPSHLGIPTAWSSDPAVDAAAAPRPGIASHVTPSLPHCVPRYHCQ